MADELRKLNPLQRSPVFQNQSGKMLNPDNLYARVLRPAMEEVGIKGGFHTFRHTVATRLFAEGRNVVQVQRWLGHSDPAFTIRTYIHLLDNDLGGPIKPLRDNRKTTGCTNPDEIEHLDFDPKTTD
jgi:integrase